MSGHNKWSKIKHKKAAADSQKSQVFGKMARLIATESKKANGDTNSPALAAAIERAKSVNMPNDNIERAVAKGKASDAADMESVTYEAYGPGGVALVIQGLTENRNKAASEVKSILTKNNLSLAEQGAASWAFERQNDGTHVAQTTIELSEDEMARLD